MARKGEELVATKFSKRFEDYNTKVLEELADIISKFKELTPSQARKLAQQLKYDRSYTELLDELSRLTKMSKKEIKIVLEEIAKEDIEFADIYFKARNMQTPIYENTKELTNIVDAALKMSEGDFVNLARSTGFTFLDRDKHIMFLDMKDTYQKVIDDCVYAISQGKESYSTVMEKTINQLVNSGVRQIVYANDGKRQYTQSIESAVRRNIMDSMRQVSMETSMELGKRFDADGIEVGVHENPAPDHMYVQGHQFKMTEFEKFQNDTDCVDVNGIEYPATSKETGRDRRSIGQYNCYHGIRQIVVGIHKPLYTDEQLQEIIDANNKGVEYEGKHYTLYEMTQLQRNIENEIRKCKHEHIFYKKLDDKPKVLYYQKRINQLQNKYKEVTAIAGVRDRLIERSRVKGYNKINIRNIKEIEYARENNKIYHTTEYIEEIINSKKLNSGSIAVGKEISNNVKYGTQYIIFKPEILSEIDNKDILFKGDGGIKEQNPNKFSNLMDMLKNKPKYYNEIKTKKDIDIIQYIDYIRLRDDESKEIYKMLEENNIKYVKYHDKRENIFKTNKSKKR